MSRESYETCGKDQTVKAIQITEVFGPSNPACLARLACRASCLCSGRDELLLGKTNQLLKSCGILDGHIR
jgi:hypothetical protein